MQPVGRRLKVLRRRVVGFGRAPIMDRYELTLFTG